MLLEIRGVLLELGSLLPLVGPVVIDGPLAGNPGHPLDRPVLCEANRLMPLALTGHFEKPLMQGLQERVFLDDLVVRQRILIVLGHDSSIERSLAGVVDFAADNRLDPCGRQLDDLYLLFFVFQLLVFRTIDKLRVVQA